VDKIEMAIIFKSGNLKGRHNFGDVRIYKRIILKWILKKYCVGVWTEFIWLTTESSDELL
jgi:hypothetical protein